MRASRLLGSLALIPLLAAVPGPVSPLATADEGAPVVLLVLDVSGSMSEADPSGVTKMQAAQAALIQSLDSLPANAQVGLRVYGAGNDGFGASGACEDTELVHPVTTLDKPGLTQAINSFSPRGDTPIAYSLTQAMADVGSSGKRHIILVSDGEETCDPDPCRTVGELTANNDVQIDTIGFGVQDLAREQLSCIAEAGGGTYYDAADAQALAASLESLGARTARPFTISGTPVRGASDTESAPVMTAGQYTDVSQPSVSGKVKTYYRVARQWQDSTLRVNVAARLPVTDIYHSVKRALWDYQLTTVDGTLCDTATEDSSDVGKLGVVVSRTLISMPENPRSGHVDPTGRSCAESTEFILSLERGAGSGNAEPIEIRVIEEAPATNDSELPAGVDTLPGSGLTTSSPASGTPQQVIGGASFNDALELSPGTYATELVPGEMVLFKTPIQWGQSATFSLDGVDVNASTLARATGNSTVTISNDVYAPDFSKMNSEERKPNAVFSVTTSGVVAQDPTINAVPEVRYRNRWDSPAMYLRQSHGFSMAGYYYYALGLGADEFLAGQPATVRFSFAVTGEPAGAPSVSDQPAAAPAVSATPQSGQSATPAQAGLSWWLYVLSTVGGAALLAVLIWLVLRLRRPREVQPRRGL